MTEDGRVLALIGGFVALGIFFVFVLPLLLKTGNQIRSQYTTTASTGTFVWTISSPTTPAAFDIMIGGLALSVAAVAGILVWLRRNR